MLSCINKNSVEFRTLKERSGLSESIVEAICRDFSDRLGRFPYLDELPNSNSETYLRNKLKIKENNSVKTEDILKLLGKETIEEAQIELNNQFRDLEIKITQLNKESIIHIKHRPSIYDITEKIEQYKESKAPLFFVKTLDKLAKLYGFNFIETNTEELTIGELKDVVKDANTAASFIYNGNIYINTDIASIDSPLHEIMHLLLSSIKFSNPDLYYNLVSLSEQFTGYDKLIKTFKNRTKSDINEELFVTEFSRFMMGEDSILSELDENTMYEISYNVHRLLDSILMGNYSSNKISSNIYSLSLKQIAQIVDSAEMNISKRISDSEIHRILQNKKEELIKSNQLKEYC